MASFVSNRVKKLPYNGHRSETCFQTATSDQLLNKRVCQKHFDKYQLDGEGNRLRHGYPCLFSTEEVEHGVPLSGDHYDHSYSKKEDFAEKEDVAENLVVTQEHPDDHSYSRTADIYADPPAPSLVNTDITTANVFETNEIQSTSKCEQSSHLNNIQIDSLESQDVIRNVEQSQSITKSPKIIGVRGRGNKFSSNTRCFIKKIRKIANKNNSKPFLQRLDAAKTLSCSHLFTKNFDKISQQAQDFILMQLKMANKKKKAMRYTTNEKHLALTLMKQSPKAYRLLQKIFNLPSKRTLNRLAENIMFKVGLNDNIFRVLQHKTRKWDTKKKLCSILFDEVSLTPHLTYVESQDEIRGFKDFGYERELRFCDHALVLMLKGVCSNWKQPICFYFCEGTTAAATVVRILKEVVTRVSESGLIPLAIVCDQGSTFRTAINMLKLETERKRISNEESNDGTIEISGLPLSVVYDPPHLLKGLRNNLLTKDMLFKGKVATWKDIESVFDADCQLGHTRMHKKLTEHHVYAAKMKKMKVSVAAQTLSATTSGMLKYTALFQTTASGSKVSETMATTGEAVEFIDKLFDSVNGSRGSAVRGKLRRPIKPSDQQHFNFWSEAKQILKNIEFIDKHSKKARKNNKAYNVRVPSLNGWVTTLESFERLSKLLFEKYHLQYFYPRNINQDPLENFFGRIRAINHRNVNPDANTFMNAFKSLLMSNVMGPHSIYANCEDDTGDTVVDFVKLMCSSNVDESSSSTFDEDKENSMICRPITVTQNISNNSNQSLNPANERLRVHSSAYTAGYLCRRVTKKFKCRECSETYTQTKIDVFHKWIEQREYNLLKHRNLAYPSKKFLILYRDISGLIHDNLNKYAHKKCVKKHLKLDILKKFNVNWLGCTQHNTEVQEWFLNLIIRMHVHVHNWCNILNKILKGGIQEKLVKRMCAPQLIAFEKYKALRLRGKK
ncbi:uncharacterized protein LOC135072744 [Ostrinia nubilalis]|uniref:uncharacterized protein LOC135072744 n=1 Tax=Ostrinia nubilalis TaxID=29057 RepID=UPI00308263DD